MPDTRPCVQDERPTVNMHHTSTCGYSEYTDKHEQLNNAAIRESVSQVQGRDDIKMKVNIQSLIPTSFYTTVATLV